MTRKLKRKYPGLGGMITCSFLFHALCFLVIQWANFLPRFHASEEPVYYVEMVNLPVASPGAGIPVPAVTAQPLPPPVTTESSEMKLPTKTVVKPSPTAAAKPSEQKASSLASIPGAKSAATAKQLDDAREYEEGLARLRMNADARHEAAALEALRKRVASGRGGMPSAIGKEAGSDYASYLQSRLKDAFKSTISFQTKDPYLRVKVVISKNGRITSYIIEQSTGDKLFEESVFRAIAKAEKGFTPPPGGLDVIQGFVFRPQGVAFK